MADSLPEPMWIVDKENECGVNNSNGISKSVLKPLFNEDLVERLDIDLELVSVLRGPDFSHRTTWKRPNTTDLNIPPMPVNVKFTTRLQSKPMFMSHDSENGGNAGGMGTRDLKNSDGIKMSLERLSLFDKIKKNRKSQKPRSPVLDNPDYPIPWFCGINRKRLTTKCSKNGTTDKFRNKLKPDRPCSKEITDSSMLIEPPVELLSPQLFKVDAHSKTKPTFGYLTSLNEEVVVPSLKITYQSVKELSDYHARYLESYSWETSPFLKWSDSLSSIHAVFKSNLQDSFGIVAEASKKHEKSSKRDQIYTAIYAVCYMDTNEFKIWLKSIRGFQMNIHDATYTSCFLLNPDYKGFTEALSPDDGKKLSQEMTQKRNLMQKFLAHLLKLDSKSLIDHYEFVKNCAIHLGDYQLQKQAQDKMLKHFLHAEKVKLFHPACEPVVYKISDIEGDGSIYDRPRDPPGQRSVYIAPGDAAMESYRLSTFVKFPQETPVNPRHLAAAGFHYTGYKDRVKCFCCGLCVESWCQGDDVKSTRWHRNNCEFINGQDSGNQPIGGLFSNFMNKPRGSGELNRDFGRGSESGNIQVQQTARPVPAGLIMKSGPNQNTPMQTARVVEPTRPASSYQRVELATIASSIHEQLVRSLDLRKESDRMKTFEVWPAQNRTVSSVHLGRSGFFYLGNLDRVQCFSCGGVLRNWNYGDNVNNEHRRHFPHCRMVQGTESRNVALPVPPQPQPTRGSNIQEPPDPSEAEKRDLENMFRCQYPVSPYMRNEESRLETYDHRWPSTNIRATPQQIAKAGFFFLGDRDRVKCWYCNGGLQNWDPDDEPWTEHAKWFPTCEFLLQRKGPDFVHRMVSLYPNLPRPILRGPFDVPPRTSGERRAQSPPPPIIDHRAEVAKQNEKLAKFMETDLVKAAVEMGFEVDVIKKMVKSKLSSGGSLQTTVAGLVDDITSYEPSDDEDEEEPVATSKSTNVKTPAGTGGSNEMETAQSEVATGAGAGNNNESSMETEPSIPPDVTPSMEARLRELQEERKCKICLDRVSNIVFVPCGHLCCCSECADGMKKCPICRDKIREMYKTFMS